MRVYRFAQCNVLAAIGNTAGQLKLNNPHHRQLRSTSLYLVRAIATKTDRYAKAAHSIVD